MTRKQEIWCEGNEFGAFRVYRVYVCENKNKMVVLRKINIFRQNRAISL